MLNNVDSYSAKQSDTGQLPELIIFKYHHSFSYIIKSSESIFDLSALHNYYAGFDQQDDYDMHHNKMLLLRVLLTDQNKIPVLRNKEISIYSSSYFELDIPPPLLAV